MSNGKLKLDVEVFVKNQLKNVKSVDEILTSDFTIESRREKDKDTLFFELLMHKKILQLMLNLFNNFNIFGNLSFRVMSQNKKYFSSFEKCFYCDVNNSIWKCVNRPDDKLMEKALLNYLVCLKELDMDNDIVEVKEEEIEIKNCPFCSNYIISKEDGCDGCASPYSEMLEYVRKVYKDKRCKDRQSIKFLTYYGFGEECNNFIEANENLIDSSKLNIKAKKEKAIKWKCSDCDFLNNYGVLNCAECLGRYENGRWTCSECMIENNCRNDCCNNCEKNKVNVKDKKCDISNTNNEEDEIKIGKNEWKCGKCGFLQSFDFIDCDKCGKSREVNGLWCCNACTLINECKDTQCIVCGFKKSLLHNLSEIKVKSKAQVVKIGNKYQGIQWNCIFSNCSGRNDDKEKYCKMCKASRFSSRRRGEPVEVLLNGVEKRVWVCHKCFKFNELTEPICKCRETRYKKIFCQNCELYNDGTSDKCYSCVNTF